MQTTIAAVIHRGTLARMAKNDLGREEAIWNRKGIRKALSEVGA
jgi:hypothetical protein